MRVWCMEIVPVKPLEKYNFLALPLLSRYLIWGNTIFSNKAISKFKSFTKRVPSTKVLRLQWWGILIWDDDKIGNLGDESHAFPANHTKCPKNFSSFLTDASLFPRPKCVTMTGAVSQEGVDWVCLLVNSWCFQLYFSHFDGKIHLRNGSQLAQVIAMPS